MPFET